MKCCHPEKHLVGGGKSTRGHLTKLVESLQSLQIQDRGQTVQFKVGNAAEDVNSTHSNQLHDKQDGLQNLGFRGVNFSSLSDVNSMCQVV